MTTEEAIESLGLLRIFDAPDLNEAVKIAISALRAQQTPAKLDRSRWRECVHCRMESPLFEMGDTVISMAHYNALGGPAIEIEDIGAFSVKFCPACGRPLTEEAWAELERRISDGTADL